MSEDLAQHIAERLSTVPADDEAAQREAAKLTMAGLLAEPAQVSHAEARWILQRVAELRGWSFEANG